METQNVTLALPRGLLRKAKILAVEKHTSLSGLLTRLIEDIVKEQDAYALARERHRALLRRPLDLGINGKITWTRDELHERR